MSRSVRSDEEIEELWVSSIHPAYWLSIIYEISGITVPREMIISMKIRRRSESDLLRRSKKWEALSNAFAARPLPREARASLWNRSQEQHFTSLWMPHEWHVCEEGHRRQQKKDAAVCFIETSHKPKKSVYKRWSSWGRYDGFSGRIRHVFGTSKRRWITRSSASSGTLKVGHWELRAHQWWSEVRNTTNN
jgi:hypothetical protein